MDVSLELLSGVIGISLLDLLLIEIRVNDTHSMTLVITDEGWPIKTLL